MTKKKYIKVLVGGMFSEIIRVEENKWPMDVTPYSQFLIELKHFLPAYYSFDWREKNKIKWMLVEGDELEKSIYVVAESIINDSTLVNHNIFDKPSGPINISALWDYFHNARQCSNIHQFYDFDDIILPDDFKIALSDLSDSGEYVYIPLNSISRHLAYLEEFVDPFRDYTTPLDLFLIELRNYYPRKFHHSNPDYISWIIVEVHEINKQLTIKLECKYDREIIQQNIDISALWDIFDQTKKEKVSVGRTWFEYLKIEPMNTGGYSLFFHDTFLIIR